MLTVELSSSVNYSLSKRTFLGSYWRATHRKHQQGSASGRQPFWRASLDPNHNQHYNDNNDHDNNAENNAANDPSSAETSLLQLRSAKESARTTHYTRAEDGQASASDSGAGNYCARRVEMQTE